MVSNSLTGRYYFGGTPPVCRKAPEPGPTIPPFAPAIQLHAYANWTDLDPVAPYAQQAMLTLHRIGPGNIYHGRSSPSSVRLELDISQVRNSDFWDVTIRTFDPGQPPEEYTWLSIYVDPDQPFDTRLLLDMHVPKQDYRIVRATL